MERRVGRYLGLVLQIVNWVCGTSRPFGDGDHVLIHPPGLSMQPSQVPMNSEVFENHWINSGGSGGGGGGRREEEEMGGRGVGSSPPRCENKCYGCVPCEPIQVPIVSSIKSSHHHQLHQFANYEPEGWRCKCGPSFYTP